jgi:hypothetical protein
MHYIILLSILLLKFLGSCESQYCGAGFGSLESTYKLIIVNNSCLNVITYGGVNMSISTGSVSKVLAGDPVYNNANAYDGESSVAKFYYPYSAQQIPGTDTLLVSEQFKIRLVNVTTGYVSTVLDPIKVAGVPQNIDGAGTSASIAYPSSVLMSVGSGFFYVANSLGVRRVTYPSVSVSSLVTSGYTSEMRSNQAISPDGSFIVMTVPWGGLIKKYVIASSTMSNIAGTGVGYTDCLDGVGSNAAFSFPRFPVISKDGLTLYVADATRHANIRKVDLLTLATTTIMGICPGVFTANNQVISGMVLSPLGTYLVVIIFTRGVSVSELKRVDLETLYVTVITPSSGSNYLFNMVLSMALVPGPAGQCEACTSGKFSLDGSVCSKCPAGSFCVSASASPVTCPSGNCDGFSFEVYLLTYVCARNLFRCYRTNFQFYLSDLFYW